MWLSEIQGMPFLIINCSKLRDFRIFDKILPQLRVFDENKLLKWVIPKKCYVKAHNFESFEQDFNDLKHYSRFFVHLISSCFLLKIRSANYLLQTTKVELYKKQKKEIGPLNVINGGWHCSWCFTPQGIR